MIRGTTTLIAHFGDPIAVVKAPLIYNPYFESAGIDAVVVPMGVRAADYAQVRKAVFRLTGFVRGVERKGFPLTGKRSLGYGKVTADELRAVAALV